MGAWPETGRVGCVSEHCGCYSFGGIAVVMCPWRVAATVVQCWVW